MTKLISGQNFVRQIHRIQIFNFSNSISLRVHNILFALFFLGLMINLQKAFNHWKYVSTAQMWKQTGIKPRQLKTVCFREQEYTCGSGKAVVRNTGFQILTAVCHTYQLALYAHCTALGLSSICILVSHDAFCSS